MRLISRLYLCMFGSSAHSSTSKAKKSTLEIRINCLSFSGGSTIRRASSSRWTAIFSSSWYRRPSLEENLT
ncbi:uncharacterized protein F4807DRAFT_434363 [Annulohypoxylon truncatum]|uniref:uncharacterized protein n=1 Tax=Annulohypoxylon truncatum TaxID=327061 RepID=UPI002008315B|nr:uncharacterized protein F4807DRAFT_434363 [Annulohypoxylon truncatum]KAI1207720.1 hypothetical protein F4807DRAFT_434363 [Annulohypoxylon truncatum]